MGPDVDSGAIISLNEAKDYVAAFRAKYPAEAKGFFIGRTKVARILAQEDCIGLRVYNGYDDKAQVMNLVFLGVDSNGDDIYNGIIVEKVLICPPACSSIGPLS